MSKNYTLYLDEILPLDHLQFFCLAGVIIEDAYYNAEVVPAIEQIKQNIFQDTSVILHEADIRKPKSGTKYMMVKQRAAREQYFREINQFFDEKNFTIIGAALNDANARSIYPNHRDRYFVCLQIILENFAHFLMKNDGIGQIRIESRNPKQDGQLKRHFNSLLNTTGTLFYQPVLLKTYIKSIDFPAKNSNDIGLQIADMIPNPVNRYLSGSKQVVPDLISKILSKTYDGTVQNVNRFGMKVLVKSA